MALNLSPEDQAEYLRRCLANEADKQAAIAAGDARGAKRARQANTALYKEFERRQLPPERGVVPLAPWEYENGLTLEDRIDRIERLLKLGRYYAD